MFACIYIPDFSNQSLRYGSNASDALLDCAQAWSPRVERIGPDAVVLDIEGLERLWGSHADIATAISNKAAELGLTVNAAVASNPDAAIHSAKAAKGSQGVIVIPQGMEAERLRDLPIAILSPPENIRRTLERWGIRTFGAIAALPRNDIAVRLGDAGVLLHLQARGRSPRLLVPHQVPLRFIESMDLDHEINLLEPLSFILARLLGQISARLKCRGLATHEIHLKLGLKLGSIEYVLRLPIPTQDSRLLSQLLQLDVESRPPKTGISSVTIEAIHTNPRVAQHGLFVPLAPEPEKLELTLARIAGIVGPENIGSAELMDTHRPGAFRMKRFITSLEDGCLEPRPVEEQAAIAFRTFRPAPESTVDMRDGRPRWIAFRGAHGPIVAASGPWRTSGDWWANEQWSRDEWDIAVAPDAGPVTLYLIYCDRTRNRWYVEGVYD